MIKHLIKDDQFFLSYGDDLSNVNLDALFEFHKMKNKIVTITTVNLKSDFGIININSNNLITKFIEKPLLKDIWINAGFAVLNRNIFNYLKFGELESTVYKLLARKREVCAFKHQGFWHGINTVKDQIYLNKLCFNGKQP
jgi:glucose-1-phosphate cytidylyltransferase